MSDKPPYRSNVEPEYTWKVQDKNGDRTLGTVKTTLKSKADAQLAAREKFGPGTYRITLQ